MSSAGKRTSLLANAVLGQIVDHLALPSSHVTVCVVVFGRPNELVHVIEWVPAVVSLSQLDPADRSLRIKFNASSRVQLASSCIPITEDGVTCFKSLANLRDETG